MLRSGNYLFSHVRAKCRFWNMSRCFCKVEVKGDGVSDTSTKNCQDDNGRTAAVPDVQQSAPVSEEMQRIQKYGLATTALGRGRLRVWHKSLSPLSRLCALIPEELHTPEVSAIKDDDQRQSDVSSQDASAADVFADKRSISPFNVGSFTDGHHHLDHKSISSGCTVPLQHVGHVEATANNSCDSAVTDDENSLVLIPSYSDRRARDCFFKSGDLVLAEYSKKRNLEFRKLFTLVAVGKLHSNWGALAFQDIIGKLPGQVMLSTLGFEFLLRRPSLEEFVLLMKRGPAISYPKDANTMLMMMDVNGGDCILEAGSGSGAMTLFLSRAVGSNGCILSFETRKDHHTLAKKNYHRWTTAWLVSHGEEWPQNVEFINQDITTAADRIKEMIFDAVALDMISPQTALPVLCPHLKQGGVCAVYLANITQVIDLLEGIRSCQIPLLCEKVVEVIHRDWLVKPAVRKDGSTAEKVEPQIERCEEICTQDDGVCAVEGE
ncbi:tRNA (adenine(58)-N(1))-methyltransferase, mitochondrial, partial [Protopterus annectens]|uniref:tRNA (adenine(58)-N(1))-methyltransferase, mitochondrial n=1 Tax=Protopterus annectens TaxID=7888 RepID=UPI001CFBE5CC